MTPPDRDGDGVTPQPKARRGRPPGVEGVETRRRILREAQTCFADFGYASAKTRTLAERTGLTTAAIYHHFGRKHDVMIAAYHEAVGRFKDHLQQAVDREDSYSGKTRALFEAVHEMISAEPDIVTFTTIAQAEAQRHEELAAIATDRSILDVFESVVEFGVESGAIDRENAAMERHALRVLATGLAVMSMGGTARSHRLYTDACEHLLDLRRPARHRAAPGTATKAPVRGH